MDTLDNETIEQIKNIVNDAKNEKAPLQKAKRTKKQKEITIIVPPTEEHNIDTEPVEMIPAKPILKRSKSTKPLIELPAPTPIKEEILPSPPVEEEILTPSLVEEELVLIVPEKKKRVQSEKQKAAFVLLQAKRKEQVEKQKLVKKIEASKLLLENDVTLKVSKPKSTTINFNEDTDSDPEDEPEEPPARKETAKVWGTSTRNKKSIKKEVKSIKVVEAKYQEPEYF